MVWERGGGEGGGGGGGGGEEEGNHVPKSKVSCTCSCTHSLKPGSQYDTGTASITSIMNVMRKTFSLVKFYP